MTRAKTPQADSIRELARFWDTHDLTDLDDQLEEVNKPVFERETVVKVHLQPEEFEAITKTADSKGVRDAELLRQWVLDKLQPS